MHVARIYGRRTDGYEQVREAEYSYPLPTHCC
jgi:hypothetical protein